MPVLAELDPAAVDRGRPPAAGEGLGRRRRPRHAPRARPRPSSPRESPPPRAEAASAFGDADGLLSSRTSSTAGTSRSRSLGDTARHVLVARRAGLLDPAPPPEGRRGGAGAGARRATARGAARRGRGGRRGDRLRRRRHRRVPATTRRRPVLLPGDEHPPAGRAPGHRVVTGVDLVEQQLAVAEGEPAAGPRPTDPPGHAIEVRLYAEDPAADYQPQSGG